MHGQEGWNVSQRKDLGAAYDKGYNWGAGVKSSRREESQATV